LPRPRVLPRFYEEIKSEFFADENILTNRELKSDRAWRAVRHGLPCRVKPTTDRWSTACTKRAERRICMAAGLGPLALGFGSAGSIKTNEGQTLFSRRELFRANVLRGARFRDGTICATRFVTRKALVVRCVIEASRFGIAFEIAFGFGFVGGVSSTADYEEDADEYGGEETRHGKLLFESQRGASHSTGNEFRKYLPSGKWEIEATTITSVNAEVENDGYAAETMKTYSSPCRVSAMISHAYQHPIRYALRLLVHCIHQLR